MATEPFDAVLAEITHFPRIYRAGVEACYGYDTGFILAKDAQALLDRLAAAHAAEVARLREEVSGLRAARLAYANEFPPNDDGEPDVGSVHANLRALKSRAEAAERDARRWRAMREHMVAVDWEPEMGGGPVVMFECMAERVLAGPEGADAIADAAVEFAAIATAEQADD